VPRSSLVSTLNSRLSTPLIAAVGGIVFGLATPPTNFYPGVFVALGTFAYLIARAETAWRGFGLGWLWATLASLVGMRFVPSVIMLFTPLGEGTALAAHVLLSAAQSLHWAFGAALGVLLHRRLRAPLELAAAGGTMLAVSLPMVFAWTPASLLTPWPELLQTGDLVGERGLSVMFTALAAAVLRSLLTKGRRWWAPATAAVAGFGALAGHGAWTMQRWASDPGVGETRIALVYAAIDPHERWDSRNWGHILAVLRAQTALAETAGVDLTVWPEAAYPYPLNHDARAMPSGQREIIGGTIDGPVLFGFIADERLRKDKDGLIVRDSYNAASIVRSDRSMLPSYDKMQLLWFGETVPLADQFPWLRRTFQQSGGLLPGKELRALDLPRARGPALHIGVLNCYEDTLPSLGRRIGRELRPNVLVNVTNDAWFVGTVEPELHFRLSVMRAIELRRDLVRSVNLGHSGWIDASGRVRADRLGTEPGHMLVTPTLREGAPTVYAMAGDWPAWCVLALAAAWAAKRAKAAPPSRSTKSSSQP
jgi:apolipoprotein N-acyltransferase